VQDVFLFSDENRVAGVIAALRADDDIRLLGEHVNDFAFAFIAPLAPTRIVFAMSLNC